MKKILSKASKITRQFVLSCLIRIGIKNNDIFTKSSLSFMELNRSLLFKILSDNKNTYYGRKYNFDEISSIEDYKKKVPVTTYQDYKPLVDRMINENATNLITAYPIYFYTKTSGTTGNSKTIPYSVPAIKVYNRYGGNNSILSRLHDNGNGNNLKNKILILATCSLNKLPNGFECGGLSEKMLSQKKNFSNFVSVVPKEIVFPSGETDTLAFQARFALEEQDISYCYLTFCTQFLQLIQYIENNQEMLIKDIRYGTIDDSLVLPENTKKKLLRKLKPNPKRADELEKIFKEGFEGIVSKIWKSFKGYAGISNGGFQIYYEKLRYYLPKDANVDMYGYTTSEGMFSLCTENNTPFSLPVAESCFFEFLPLDETDYSKTLTLDEIKEGNEYRLIITNQSGFYRYDMHDIITVGGYLNNCPLITFVRRDSQCLNTIGEKISVEDVTTAVYKTFEELCVNVIDYVVSVNNSSPIGYVFYVETVPDFDITKAEIILSGHLNACCEVLSILISRGQLSSPRIYRLSKDSFSEYRKYRDRAHNNQYKQLHILEDEDSVNFFKSRITR